MCAYTFMFYACMHACAGRFAYTSIFVVVTVVVVAVVVVVAAAVVVVVFTIARRVVAVVVAVVVVVLVVVVSSSRFWRFSGFWRFSEVFGDFLRLSDALGGPPEVLGGSLTEVFDL